MLLREDKVAKLKRIAFCILVDVVVKCRVSTLRFSFLKRPSCSGIVFSHLCVYCPYSLCRYFDMVLHFLLAGCDENPDVLDGYHLSYDKLYSSFPIQECH
ncbi:hypothetical protein Droror1_Dr00004311 [Drosera rotundifolia]